MKINRTKILMALLVLVILVQVFPDRAARIELAGVVAGAVYFAIWGALRLLSAQRTRRAAAVLEAADAAEYQQYKAQLDAIRARHATGHEPGDLTSISPELQADLNALHDKHEAMLTRKFGPR